MSEDPKLRFNLGPARPATKLTPVPADGALNTDLRGVVTRFPTLALGTPPINLHPDRTQPIIDFLKPLQTPSEGLLRQLPTMPLEEVDKIVSHYKRTLSPFEHNTFELQNVPMVLMASQAPYLSDVSPLEAGHVLCIPQQRSFEAQKDIVAALEEISEKRHNNQDCLEEIDRLRILCKKDALIPPPNNPRVDMLIQCAQTYSRAENVADRVIAQNCAPRSASIPAHLHLHLLPKGESYFPFLDLDPSKRFLPEIITQIEFPDGQKIAVQGINTVGTVIGMNLSNLSETNRAHLCTTLNKLIKATQTEYREKGTPFGMDLMVVNDKEGLMLYLGFRNEQKGGLYSTFGMTNDEEFQATTSLQGVDEARRLHTMLATDQTAQTIIASLPQGQEPVRNPALQDQFLSSNREPKSQVGSAAFLAKLHSHILRPDLPKRNSTA